MSATETNHNTTSLEKINGCIRCKRVKKCGETTYITEWYEKDYNRRLDDAFDELHQEAGINTQNSHEVVYYFDKY